LSTLFTFSKSWHDATFLFEQLGFASQGDSILLLQDAVLASHSPITLASFLAKCEAGDVAVYALRDDILLRGVNNKYPQLKSVDYAGFVALVSQHDKQVAW